MRKQGFMLPDFVPQKLRAAAKLLDAFHAIFDADPAVEAHAGQLAKDRIVVVEPLADFTVAQPLGISDGVFLFAQVLNRSFRQIAVTGVHGDDTVFHPAQQFKRIFSGQDRVAGIVIHPKVRRLDPINEFAKYIHLLGKFRILPVVVLVVVLNDQRDPALGGVRNARLDAVGGVANSIGPGNLRPPLARKHAAEFGAQCRPHVDPRFLRVDLLLAECRIRVREVRRAAEHGNTQSLVHRDLPRRRPKFRIAQFQKARVKLQAIDIQTRSQFHPLSDGHRAADAQIIHVSFGKSGEFGHELNCRWPKRQVN
jgi:hypothetical protein